MNVEVQRVKRCVILIEMEDGLQIGYQVDGPATEVTISRLYDDDDRDPWGQILQPPWPGRGRIEAEGRLTGLVKMPSDAFGERPAIEPERMEIEG